MSDDETLISCECCEHVLGVEIDDSSLTLSMWQRVTVQVEGIRLWKLWVKAMKSGGWLTKWGYHRTTQHA